MYISDTLYLEYFMRTKLLLIIAISVLFAGCSSIKSIKFNELMEKMFDLEYISFMTNVAEYNDNVKALFSIFPIEAVGEKVMLEYGININSRSYRDNEYTLNSYNLGMPNYFIKIDTESYYRVAIYFDRFHQGKEHTRVLFKCLSQV